MMERSSWSVAWSVWRALLIREAMHRLFYRRAAWVWVLLEPLAHVAFLMFIFSVFRVRVIGGMDTEIWIMVGLLGFFMFKRAMIIGMGAVAMAKPLFTYRQLKPIDAVFVRVVSEGLLMAVISLLLLIVAGLFGLSVLPDDCLKVLHAMFGLWLLGLGAGMMLSVPRELVRETEDIVNMVMTPFYFFSGVIFPIALVPQPYHDWLLLNPIAHGIDAVRLGFAGHYQPFDGLSFTYIYFIAVFCIFFGLIFHRVFRTRLIQL